MSVKILITDQLEIFFLSQIDVLIARENGPIFYKSNFIRAVHEHQLLPLSDRRYILAYRDELLVGFCPSYRMMQFDPFGVIQTSLGIRLPDDPVGWLSHITHFYESTIICEKNDNEVREAILSALFEICVEDGADCCGLTNVLDEPLLNFSQASGWRIGYMWDRYYVDLNEIKTIQELYETLERSGRKEVRRQLRKFESEGAQFRVLRAPFDNLERVAELCYLTTKKNGTPQYYPPEKFSRFVAELGDDVLIFEVWMRQQLVGAIVAFEANKILHLWAGGMVYENSYFSPYTVLIYKAYEYAIQNGFSRLEAGRTNKRIKERLGFKSIPLYSIIKLN